MTRITQFKGCEKEGKHCADIERDEELVEEGKKKIQIQSKCHPRRGHEGQEGGEVYLYPFLNLGARCCCNDTVLRPQICHHLCSAPGCVHKSVTTYVVPRVASTNLSPLMKCPRFRPQLCHHLCSAPGCVHKSVTNYVVSQVVSTNLSPLV